MLASSINPFLSFIAPVNAPALWPNISLSNNSFPKALQLSAIKGLPVRWLPLCMACANTSLPVPVSPSNKTEACVGATFFANEIASSINGELPRILSKPYFLPTCCSSFSIRFCSCAFSIARFIRGIILSLSLPLVM